MGRTTGSLVVALGVHSGLGAHKTMERPRSGPGAGNTGYGAGPTLNTDEGADMAKSTRGVPPSDSETQVSAVNITPASSTVPVPATPSLA